MRKLPGSWRNLATPQMLLFCPRPWNYFLSIKGGGSSWGGSARGSCGLLGRADLGCERVSGGEWCCCQVRIKGSMCKDSSQRWQWTKWLCLLTLNHFRKQLQDETTMIFPRCPFMKNQDKQSEFCSTPLRCPRPGRPVNSDDFCVLSCFYYYMWHPLASARRPIKINDRDGRGVSINDGPGVLGSIVFYQEAVRQSRPKSVEHPQEWFMCLLCSGLISAVGTKVCLRSTNQFWLLCFCLSCCCLGRC